MRKRRPYHVLFYLGNRIARAPYLFLPFATVSKPFDTIHDLQRTENKSHKYHWQWLAGAVRILLLF